MKEEFKKFCEYCGEKRDIVELVSTELYEIYQLLCGHSISKKVKGKASIKYLEFSKYFDLKKKVLRARFDEEKIPEEKIRETISIDREKGKIFYKLEEKNEKGEWEIKGKIEEKPFP